MISISWNKFEIQPPLYFPNKKSVKKIIVWNYLKTVLSRTLEIVFEEE